MATTTIRILDDRKLRASSSRIGTVGEHNAEILKFIKPQSINGQNIDNFQMKVIFNNVNGSFIRDVYGDEISLNSPLTVGELLTVIVQFVKGNEVKWTSIPLPMHLYGGGDESGEHTGNDAEEMIQTLANKLFEVCGAVIEPQYHDDIVFPTFSEMTYEELIDFLPQFKELFSKALLYTSPAIDTTLGWTFKEIVESLFDFSYGEIRMMQDQILQMYRVHRQMTDEEFNEDEFIQTLISRRATRPFWEEITDDVYDVINKVSEMTDKDDIVKVREHFEDIYGGDWSFNTDWRSLFSAHRFAQRGLYSLCEEITGEIPETFSEVLTILNTVKSSVISAIEEKTGQTIDTSMTLNEVIALISEISAGGEISESSASIPFKFTENGVTTNLEFTVIDGEAIIRQSEE